uniref:Ovule protein n=1 Tax=Loa loa TaxID=7209 RepID=A0A1I7VLM7_LOALO
MLSLSLRIQQVQKISARLLLFELSFEVEELEGFEIQDISSVTFLKEENDLNAGLFDYTIYCHSSSSIFI